MQKEELFMMKKFTPFVVAIVVSLSCCFTTVFAAETPDSTDMHEGVNTLTLIEDNGQDYEEEIINVNTRGSGSYETSFTIKGGVYTQQSWKTDKEPTFDVTITTTSFEAEDLNLGSSYTVFLEKKGALGYAPIDEGEILIKEGHTDSVKLTGDGAGTYRLYIRNYTGFEASGDLYVKFSY